MSKIIKIGRTSFNVDEIKKLTFDEFKCFFVGKLDADIAQVYEQITKKKAKAKAKKK
jgi:hypothetical protein